MIARLATLAPSSPGYFYSPALARRVAAALSSQSFDFVFVHCSSVAQYVDDAEGLPKVLDFGDMDSQKWLEYSHYQPWPLSMGYWLEGRKLERAEARLARRFDLCTCTTLAERETLDAYGTGTPTDWFPNGVDAEYFSPGKETYDANRLCFVGRMDYFPNQQGMFEFCRTVWPELRRRRPTLELVIVGADPSPAVRELGKLPGVTVTGSVPDVRPYVSRSVLTLAPLSIARGTQNKILESMALGVPVISSPLAAKGVDAVAGEHLLTASTPAQWAQSVLRLVEDSAARGQFAEAARVRVLSHHSWAASMVRLDRVIERARELHRAGAQVGGSSKLERAR
jgi:sugar transferase (PEP-CTERM/EpsH1 system associated)